MKNINSTDKIQISIEKVRDKLRKRENINDILKELGVENSKIEKVKFLVEKKLANYEK